MSKENNNNLPIWQYKGYDNGYQIYPDTIWRNLELYRSNACENAYKNGLKTISTNDGEYQFDLEKMEMYIVDFAFVSKKIEIRRNEV